MGKPGDSGTVALDVRPRVNGRATAVSEERLKEGRGAPPASRRPGGMRARRARRAGLWSWPDSAFPGPAPVAGSDPLQTPPALLSLPPERRRLLRPLCWPRPLTQPLVRHAQRPAPSALPLPCTRVHTHCGWAGAGTRPEAAEPPAQSSGASRSRWKRALRPFAILIPHPPPLGRRHLLPGAHVKVLRAPPPRVLLPDVSVQEVLSETPRKRTTRKLHCRLPGWVPLCGPVYTGGARAAPHALARPQSTVNTEVGRRQKTQRPRDLLRPVRGILSPPPSTPAGLPQNQKQVTGHRTRQGRPPDPRGAGLTEPVSAPRPGHAASGPAPHGARPVPSPGTRTLFPPAQVLGETPPPREPAPAPPNRSPSSCWSVETHCQIPASDVHDALQYLACRLYRLASLTERLPGRSAPV